MNPYIVFDIEKVKKLQDEYQASIDYTLELLPAINWDSHQQIKTFFHKSFKIPLADVKIRTLEGWRSMYEHDPAIFDVLTGAIQYFKLKAILKNYIDCILRHAEGDRLYLRDCDGIWKMPNKQPITSADEVRACIKSYSPELASLFDSAP